jgi:peptidoglycan/xylan/chitin deacetylase (PgdA/CDA1 family)
MDSPIKLLDFYGMRNSNYTSHDLDDFYRIALERALSLFDACNIKVTFFVVGEELEKSPSAWGKIQEAFLLGHEIANHTYTHCFGLTKLDEQAMYAEIARCSEVIEKITGVLPQGFRAPGYDMNNKVMELLIKLHIQYDSSGNWSLLAPVIQMYHKLLRKQTNIHSGYGQSSWRLPVLPYYPSKENWQLATRYREIVEVPLPRTKLFRMPFYSNFHLLTPISYRFTSIKHMKLNFFVYLMHLIEFVDLTDNIPPSLYRHPNLRTAIAKKMHILKSLILGITERYQSIRTDLYLKRYWKNGLE